MNRKRKMSRKTLLVLTDFVVPHDLRPQRTQGGRRTRISHGRESLVRALRLLCVLCGQKKGFRPQNPLESDTRKLGIDFDDVSEAFSGPMIVNPDDNHSPLMSESFRPTAVLTHMRFCLCLPMNTLLNGRFLSQSSYPKKGRRSE